MSSDLKQTRQLEFFAGQGEGPWTVLRSDGHYCALSKPEQRDWALSSPAWNLTVTDGAPGFSQSWPNGEETTTYHPGVDREGVEPLVLVRDFHGVAESSVELEQQFRLFHNLRYDQASGQFFKIADDGTQVLAAKIEGDEVSVRTSLVRQYMAARQLDLLLFVDSVVWAEEEDSDLPAEQEIRTDRMHAVRYVQRAHYDNFRYFSRLLATKVLFAGPRETCGLWPYDEHQEHFPEFIIGEDDYGRPVSYTSNPDLLANYFGANPDAPHYLTPVHFRKEVLQKYYARPELYSVGDGYLGCAGLWGVRIDNDHDDRVVVFLGDLGRDLPTAERDYWRGYMIAPDANMSETNIRRSFLAQPTDPSAADLIFKRAYPRANQAWFAAFGWPLFREPKEADVYLLQRLRLPLNDSNGEFESAIELLAKLMSDAINEKEVSKLLPDKIPNEKGISKLERLLQLRGYPQVERDISYLRRVQELRSKLTAHLKGRDSEAVLAKHLGDRRGIEAVRWLLESGTAFLNSVSAWAGAAAVDGETSRN
ncbi:hypothetical protein [Kineococcus sp. SYSU DK006]|uniref:hypothetical protein n=1 Tax=Kineococcus sp. SYSU DK006 TaxID=3383127 RepID=UPI003D7E1115